MKFPIGQMKNNDQAATGDSGAAGKRASFVFPTIAAKKDELRDKLEQREEPKQYDAYDKAAKIARSEKVKPEKAKKAAKKAAPECAQPVNPLDLRIGIGYDVHAFAKGRKLVLGGVDIPHTRGLKGHSDADVLAHAVADALLGAMRGGDIGKLFPDTDPAYKDADSMVLLAQVAAFVRSKGFEILDVDSVIAAQAPKLSPYRDEMRVNLAQAMGIDLEHVGVKATTTEHLGFEGREEGVSATATCLLRRCSQS